MWDFEQSRMVSLFQKISADFAETMTHLHTNRPVATPILLRWYPYATSPHLTHN